MDNGAFPPARLSSTLLGLGSRASFSIINKCFLNRAEVVTARLCQTALMLFYRPHNKGDGVLAAQYVTFCHTQIKRKASMKLETMGQQTTL